MQSEAQKSILMMARGGVMEHADYARIMDDLDGIVQAALQLKYAEGGATWRD